MSGTIVSTIHPITENSWFIRSGEGSIIGLMYKLEGDTYLVANKVEKKYFNTFDDIKETYGTLEIKERTLKKTNDTVNGYPVKHEDIEIVCEDPPMYYKTNGKTEFVAGYWGLLFKNGWSPAFCPKASTVLSNEAIGPFKNRLEMLNQIASLNSQINLGVNNET